MTVIELAEHLQVAQTTIYRLLRSEHIGFVKVGGTFRFDRDEVKKWLADRQLKERR